MNMRLIPAALIVSAFLAGSGATAAVVNHQTTRHPAPRAVVLKPCRTEDDMRDCYWDARHRGNGQGRSFIIMGGHLYRDAGAVD